MNDMMDIYKKFSLEEIIGEKKKKEVSIVSDLLMRELDKEIKDKMKTT